MIERLQAGGDVIEVAHFINAGLPRGAQEGGEVELLYRRIRMPRASVELMCPAAWIAYSHDGEEGGRTGDHVGKAVFPAKGLGFADAQGFVHDFADDIGAAAALSENLETVDLGVVCSVQVLARGGHRGGHFRRKCCKFGRIGGVGHCHFVSLAA